MELAEIYRDVRQKMAEARPGSGDRLPELRDFLNAGMPLWMAEAADRHLTSDAHKLTGSAEDWWNFVRCYASATDLKAIA